MLLDPDKIGASKEMDGVLTPLVGFGVVLSNNGGSRSLDIMGIEADGLSEFLDCGGITGT